MKASQLALSAVSALIVVTQATSALAYTVPNKADSSGNRTIRCEDGTTFTHHGTYQQALDSAAISCKNHGGKWVIEDTRATLSANPDIPKMASEVVTPSSPASSAPASVVRGAPRLR